MENCSVEHIESTFVETSLPVKTEIPEAMVSKVVVDRVFMGGVQCNSQMALSVVAQLRTISV